MEAEVPLADSISVKSKDSKGGRGANGQYSHCTGSGGTVADIRKRCKQRESRASQSLQANVEEGHGEYVQIHISKDGKVVVRSFGAMAEHVAQQGLLSHVQTVILLQKGKQATAAIAAGCSTGVGVTAGMSSGPGISSAGASQGRKRKRESAEQIEYMDTLLANASECLLISQASSQHFILHCIV